MGLLARTLLQWAADPAGKIVPIHIAWFLIWVAAIGGLCFLVFHAIYVRYFAKAKIFAEGAPPEEAQSLPARIPRHSLMARLYHWIMAASMLTLLITAFLPKVGPQFDWVTWHWIAGSVLTVSVLFHIVHASVWLDFRAIWPDRIDLQDAWRRAPSPRWRTSSTTWPSPSPDSRPSPRASSCFTGCGRSSSPAIRTSSAT